MILKNPLRKHWPRYIGEAAIYGVVLFLGILFLGGFFPMIRFVSEKIIVTVNEDDLYVEGFYHYYNPLPFPVTQGLSVPFPQGDGLLPADLISVERISLEGEGSSSLLPVRVIKQTPYFELKAPSRKPVSIRVVYRQGHSKGIGRYLLTTTAPWRRPIQEGRYELWINSGSLITSNYPVEPSGDREGFYFFEKTNFWPEEDWIFEFEQKGGDA